MNNYVHPNSARCDKSEIDLFDIPSTQLSLEKGRWIDYHALSSVENDDGPITFLIAGTEDYIDMSKMILVIELKITKSDGTPLGGNEQSSVAPINNFLHSLFKQVDVYLNGKQVTPAMGTYAYLAYLETLLNYDVSAKQSQLTSALYYKDTPGHMDSTGSLPTEESVTVVTGHASRGHPTTKTLKYLVPESGNQGFAKRHKFIQDGKLLVMAGPIFCDAFMTEQLLLSMVDLKVILNRNSDKFCLVDKNNVVMNAKVKLVDATLKVRKVKVNDTVSKAHEMALRSVPATYPIRRVECKAFTIPGNLPQIRKDNMFAGIIPKTFICGFVEADAFSGVYGKNPYNFQHFNVSSVTLTANEEEIPFKQQHTILWYRKNEHEYRS
ncbi:uncharacterized protein F54H12.2-like [Dendronephthya gigantea]|uniref:uncharacterized protein F54H12.2-like n=1 Tax=Dendronephthya gigantea TaxID=151771 RepID=UPI00106BDC01|nr:uncharacterized protein F54H12.2-like [Dendronephthya gigantea]